MARHRKLIDRVPLVSNVSMKFKIHLEEMARQASAEKGKLITLSELIRNALEKLYPGKEEFNEPAR